MRDVIAYCRPGFEAECGAELCDRLQELGVPGEAQGERGAAFVRWRSRGDAATALERLGFDSLVFARQVLSDCMLLEALPADDRITAIVAAAGGLAAGYSEVWIETADTNAAKELQRLGRALHGPLRRCLQEAALLTGEGDAPRLHVFLQSSRSAFVGVSRPGNSAAWPMGIPRLRMPSGAPSRSTLKLEEALLTFLDEPARSARLRPGLRAVDLGAAPGGWTWQLVRRGLRVTAVDNGAMDAALMASGLVEHRRKDGFHFRPRKPVDWLVCDMVEKPGRIAALVAQWCREGWCREAVFNLKLPMKRRYETLLACQADMEAALAGRRHTLRFKQLYHDREEVTGHCRLT